jgi:hypothetical protein
MTIACDECYGNGLLFFGNDQDYHCEPCACVEENN